MTPEQKVFENAARLALMNPCPIHKADANVAAQVWFRAEPSAVDIIRDAFTEFEERYAAKCLARKMF